jgi:hypothetical protein
MLAGLVRALVPQEKQLLLQQAQIGALQQAIELMGRHQRYAGSILPSNSGFSGSGYTGVPGPGYLPLPGSSSSSQPSTQKQNQKQKNVEIRPAIAIQPSHPHPRLMSVPAPRAASSSSSSHASELELLLSTQPKKTSLASPLQIHESEADTGADGPLPPSTPAPALVRVDWFDATRDHSSSRSVYEEYQKYERELDERLNKSSTNKRRRKQKERQTGDMEKHISNCRMVAVEVDILKERMMQKNGSLSETQALSEACSELDGLVRMASNRSNFSLNQAREFCAVERRLRKELEEQEATERADEEVDGTESE